MSLLGKIFTVCILLASFFLMIVAMFVYATHKNWSAAHAALSQQFREAQTANQALEAKYTDIRAELTNIVNNEFVHARAPIPAVGVIGRVYPAPNISITGEFSFFKLPDSIDEDYGGNYYDFDLYGTVNFNDHVGAQGGYRSLVVFYRVDNDEGDMKVKGLYFGGVVRF